MTIKVTKPSINLREALSDLKQDTGLKGQELMRADTVAEARTAIGAGRKNLIINGGFDVWQRGTSSNTTGYVSADRWYQSYANTVTKETDGNDNVMKVIGQGHSASRFGQKIEGGKLRGKTVTLSFTVKSPDSTSMTLRWGHSPETQTSTYEQAITSAWQRYSHTINLGDGTGATDVFTFFEFYVRYSDTYYFKDVQLELGSVATDFEHRSYGEELALCQRYYQKHPPEAAVDGSDGQGMALGRGYCGSNVHGFSTFTYPVMRIAPTFSYAGQAHANCVSDLTVSGMVTYTSALGYFSVNANITAEHPVRVPVMFLNAEL